LIVTTPEKWDVITRKADDLVKKVRLLIIDEIHLLHEERGAVIETLVARTLRMVERTQKPIRMTLFICLMGEIFVNSKQIVAGGGYIVC
jgi:antiviral helicase SLH1